ncbi:MAG: transcriptional regulator [Verrucomicrobiota bacterium]
MPAKPTPLQQARDTFIAQWGALGSSWGINRTMAQVHAFLLAHNGPVDTNAAMEQLQISRGNANMNLRELVEWGLVRSFFVPGDRKEYFEAEKDVWKIFCAISRERKRREIEPAGKVLRECEQISKPDRSKEAESFRSVIRSLADFVELSDSVMENVAKRERSKVVPLIIKALGLGRRKSK